MEVIAGHRLFYLRNFFFNFFYFTGNATRKIQKPKILFSTTLLIFFCSGAAKKNAATYVMSERPSSWSKIVGKRQGDETKCRFWPKLESNL